MADQDPTKEYVCPYNKYHVISAKKYPTHVAGCRNMYTGVKFESCPFNARHQFPAVEYEYHIGICPDQDLVVKEISEVHAPNVPQINHHPICNEPSPTEDWESEANQPGFSISGSILENEDRTAYDVMEDYQYELSERASAESVPSRLVVDMSGMSKVQKKNFKRAEKRRLMRMTEEGINCEEEDESEDGVHEMTAEEEEETLQKIAREYATPGRTADAFVDWISILNKHCQKNRINVPKYSEAHNSFGGFGASVVVGTERFLSNTACKTKKEGKHSAARAALLGLNIAVATPDPCRAPHQGEGDLGRIQELEANRQWLEHNIQSNQQRIIPGLSHQPTSSNQSSSQQTSQQNHQSNSDVNVATKQMAGVNINQNPYDQWHVVGRKSKDSGRAPGAPANNNALRLAGRGRGRASTTR